MTSRLAFFFFGFVEFVEFDKERERERNRESKQSKTLDRSASSTSSAVADLAAPPTKKELGFAETAGGGGGNVCLYICSCIVQEAIQQLDQGD